MEFEFLEAIVYSIVVALLLLGVPKSILARLGRITFQPLGWRPLSPNWVTAHSVLITLVGLWVYQRGFPQWGFVTIVGASILDRLDGKVAFAIGETLAPPSQWTRTRGIMNQWFAPVANASGTFRTEKLGTAKTWLGRWWLEFNFPGGTDLGKIFDPFGDKLKSLTIVVYFSQRGFLSPWLVGALFIPEIVGTIIRRPFYCLEHMTQTSKATAVGKYKVLIQWIMVILCALYDQQWVEPNHWAKWNLNWLMGLVILLAVASVASRLKWVRHRREVKDFMDTLEKSTEHE
jgi:phosphatidylglycerophosphate synthase